MTGLTHNVTLHSQKMSVLKYTLQTFKMSYRPRMANSVWLSLNEGPKVGKSIDTGNRAAVASNRGTLLFHGPLWVMTPQGAVSQIATLRFLRAAKLRL